VSFVEAIARKRDGEGLERDDVRAFVEGATRQSLPAEQLAAMLMAICCRGMSADETAWLTGDMLHSGEAWELGSTRPEVIDKHSTGGVGDKVSFLLAPIAAACGCYVPMISGRGLGHTGGTTDKAESIPGYNATPDFATFRRVVSDVGCAIIGQTADLAPADRRFYAIRDVTGTVESVPLITASILAKKIAAGLDALVMDVKVGSGAFMSSQEKAVKMSESIIETAAKAGLKSSALITDMNEVLGTTAGNALEIEESMAYLRNDKRDPRLDEVVLGLCAEMLEITGLEADHEKALSRCDEAVCSGRAAEIFDRMCVALGGPADFVANSEKHLASAPVVREVHASGYLSKVDAFAIGNAIIELGGGRRMVGEKLDMSVGFSNVARIGTLLDNETPLAIVHAASQDDAARVEKLLLAACTTSEQAPPVNPVIYDKLSGQG
jgi:thymidine phosphorylase